MAHDAKMQDFQFAEIEVVSLVVCFTCDFLTFLLSLDAISCSIFVAD